MHVRKLSIAEIAYRELRKTIIHGWFPLDHVSVALRLEHSMAAQRIAIKKGGMMEYPDPNHGFHLKVSQTSGSPRAAKISDGIGGQVRLLVNSSPRVPVRPGQSLKEHVAIVEAIATGDGLRTGTYALAYALNSEETLLGLLNSSSTEAKH